MDTGQRLTTRRRVAAHPSSRRGPFRCPLWKRLAVNIEASPCATYEGDLPGPGGFARGPGRSALRSIGDHDPVVDVGNARARPRGGKRLVVRRPRRLAA